MSDFDPDSTDPVHVMIDDPAVAPLIDGYLSRRREELVQLRSAVEAGDFGKARSIGHNLHGSGGAYYLDQLSVFGKAMEAAAEEADGPKLNELVDVTQAYIDRLVIDAAGGD